MTPEEYRLLLAVATKLGKLENTLERYEQKFAKLTGKLQDDDSETFGTYEVADTAWDLCADLRSALEEPSNVGA